MAAIVDQRGRQAERGPADGLGELAAFRQRWYGCLGRRADALFELTDALLCAPGPVGSLPQLSLEPAFRRGWGSLYGALARGSVDVEATRDLLAAVRPRGWPLVFAIDQTSWPRCDAETSPQRGIYYHPSRHSAGQPVVAGWCYQWACQLGWDHDSWTAPVDARRIRPAVDPAAATVAQVAALLGRLGATPQVPLLVFDAGYDPVALTVDLAAVRAAVLVRIRSDRVFYADPPERPAGTTGRPRRHGPRFACQDPATWPAPVAALTTTDDQYGQVVVRAWSGLPPKLGRRGRWAAAVVPPVVRGTVIRVQVSRLPKPSGPVKVLWLWWAGPGRPDLDVVWRAYVRRFDVEHTLRFCKQALGWVTPRVRHPEQADRWTWAVIAASTQLRLARHAVADSGCRGNGGLVRVGSPHPCPAGLSPAPRDAAGGGRCAETLRAGSGPAQGQPPRPRPALPRGQEERRARRPEQASQLKRKLSSRARWRW